RSVRRGFIITRVRSKLRHDPSLVEDSQQPVKKLAATKLPEIRAELARDIPRADLAYEEIWSLVARDAAQSKLLPLESSPPIWRKYRGRIGSPRAMRRRLIFQIVWRAVAADSSLLILSERLEDLHMLVDRRLRTVEQMLYYVGNVEDSERTW